MTSKVKPVDIAELASKVLDLPKETKQKQPSRKLLQVTKEFIIDFAKTKERANQIIKLGRKEGFKDSEIDKIVTQAMKEKGYSAMVVGSFQYLLDS